MGLTHPNHVQAITCFCENCDLDFNVRISGPEQAPCPLCKRICITGDVEDQQQRRIEATEVRFRFSLQTLLVGMGVFCVFLGLSVVVRYQVFADTMYYGFPLPAAFRRAPDGELVIHPAMVIVNVFAFAATWLFVARWFRLRRLK